MEIHEDLGASKNLADLPVELLEVIFSMVPPDDIFSLTETCSRFKNVILDNEDRLWAKVCHNYYKIEIQSLNGFARRFHNNVLKRYGNLLGLWTQGVDDTTSCGRLLHIQYRDGQLIGQDLQLPRSTLDLAEPLRPKTLFRIAMDEENGGKAIIKCCISPSTSESDLDFQYSLGHFVLKHVDANVGRSYHDEIDERAEFLQQVNDLQNNELDQHIFVEADDLGEIITWSPRYNLDMASHYFRLRLPVEVAYDVPIRQGLFRAISAWSSQGQIKLSHHQLVVLDYNEKTAFGTQITWDLNAGNIGDELNFKADLGQCLVMANWKDLPQEAFVIPEIYQEDFPDLPTECLAKFPGFAAPISGNTNLDGEELLVEGQWIIFNENLCAFLGNHDGSPQLTVYHRQKYPEIHELQH